ncbi:MAG: hypothetical protein FWH40_05640 [Coriobacteriia bacterium]|nr:hypothetical protein [Coriobacteriia bacterium]
MTDITRTDPGSPSYQCATRWPILLVHGVASRRAERFAYWGRIPETLEQYGARVYVSTQDAWGRYESNAKQLRAEILQILKTEHVEKVNLIAHSKGGLDSRVLATLPDMHNRIASISTLSSPHLGIKSLNWIALTPELVKRVMTTPLDVFFILSGDSNPAFLYVLDDLSERTMQEFNEHYPLPDDVYFQSFSAIKRKISDSGAFALSSSILQVVEGDNDGVVPAWSSDFGNYQGVLNAEGEMGLSHIEITNRSFIVFLALLFGIPYDRQDSISRDGFDVLAWWVEMVAELKQMGF